MKRALCKKTDTSFLQDNKERLAYIEGRWYDMIKFDNGKIWIFGEGIGITWYNKKDFYTYFYTEKQLRKLKLEAINKKI